MTCGCQSACGCDVVGDDVTASVVRTGDTFTVSSISPILGVADSDCVELDIDGSKILTAAPILAPGTSDGGASLSCTPGGLEASVDVDPASTAIVSTSAAGLRVDIPPTPAGDTGAPGDLIFHGGIGTRANAIDADGSEVPRAGYSELHDALSLYATTADRSVGSAVINTIPSTRFIRPGMPVEATGFAGGTTVVSVDSSTAITVSSVALSTGSDTEVRVYPHGNGDGVSTFNTPNMSRRFPLGYDYALGGDTVGDLGGAESTTLAAGNLPLHNHGAGTLAVATSINGAGNIAGVTDPAGSHNHTPGTNTRSFVTAEAGPGPTYSITNVTVSYDGAGAPGSGNDYSIVVDFGGFQQRNNRLTSLEPDHQHAFSIAAATIASALSLTSGAVSGSTGNAGSANPDPVDTMPPHMVGRWMVHV